MIDRCVRAFLQGLACSQTGVQGGRLLRSAKRRSRTDMLVADCVPLGWQRLKDSPGLSRDGPVLSAAWPKLLDFRSIARVSG